MSKEVNISVNVQEVIKNIIAKEKFGPASELTYKSTFEGGEGYASKSVAVSVKEDGKEPLELFVKSALKTNTSEPDPFENYYTNELHFYDVIYPSYLEFQERKNVGDGFRNVPRCYLTSKQNVIALENLKKKGYKLFDKSQVLNDDHIVLVFKTLAKFHAISFALKDQNKEKYEELIANVTNVFELVNEHARRARRKVIIDFLTTLDPVEDKNILDGAGDLDGKLNAFLDKNMNITSRYAILVHGDCWINNLMFLYEDETERIPSDVMLIDWQMILITLPIYDLSFFLYSIASKEALENLRYFLKVYHEELSTHIRKLGSDPEILYPFSVFEEQWKEHGKYGLLMAFLMIRLVLTQKDEAWNYEEIGINDPEKLYGYPEIKNHDEYVRRLKILLEHFIINGFL